MPVGTPDINDIFPTGAEDAEVGGVGKAAGADLPAGGLPNGEQLVGRRLERDEFEQHATVVGKSSAAAVGTSGQRQQMGRSR